MPEQVIAAIMQRRNPRTGQNYTRDEAEAIIAKHKLARDDKGTAARIRSKHWRRGND